MVDTTFITNKCISFYVSINKQFVSVVAGSVGNKQPTEMIQSSATGFVCAERRQHVRLNKSRTRESKARACSSEAAVSLQTACHVVCAISQSQLQPHRSQAQRSGTRAGNGALQNHRVSISGLLGAVEGESEVTAALWE